MHPETHPGACFQVRDVGQRDRSGGAVDGVHESDFDVGYPRAQALHHRFCRDGVCELLHQVLSHAEAAGVPHVGVVGVHGGGLMCWRRAGVFGAFQGLRY